MSKSLSECANKLSDNPCVLKKDDLNFTKWLKNCENNLKKENNTNVHAFNWVIHFLNKLSDTVNKPSVPHNAHLSFGEKKGSSSVFYIGEMKGEGSNLEVKNGRVLIKIKRNLTIRFIIEKKYQANFDYIMCVKHTNKESHKGKTYEGKYSGKTEINACVVRAVDFELDDRLFDSLSNYFSMFLSTTYYMESHLLKSWMPAVFSVNEEDSEADYQKKSQEGEGITLPEGPIKKIEVRGERWKRNPNIAKTAIDKASNKCIVDNAHETFISNSSKRQYVEAHHIYPMKYQNDFNVSLDVPENIAVLCPNCHRKVHLAVADERKKIIEILFRAKKEGLEEREIESTLEDLIKLYDEA